MGECYDFYIWQDGDGTDCARCFTERGEVRARSRSGEIGALCRELMALGLADGPWRAYAEPHPPAADAPVAAPGPAAMAMVEVTEEEGEDADHPEPFAQSAAMLTLLLQGAGTEDDEPEDAAALAMLDQPALRLRMTGPSIHRAAKWIYREDEQKGVIVRARWTAYINERAPPRCGECGEAKYILRRRCVGCGGWVASNRP